VVRDSRCPSRTARLPKVAQTVYSPPVPARSSCSCSTSNAARRVVMLAPDPSSSAP